MRQLLGELKQALSDHGLLDAAQSAGTMNFAAHLPGEFPIEGPVWVDDLSLLISDDTPDGLIAKVALATRLLTDIAARYGLDTNLQPGKTECVLRLRGAGIRQTLAKLPWADGHPLIALDDSRSIRVVQRYNHLGTIFSRTDTLTPELKDRANQAGAALSHIGRILSNRAIDRRHRICFFTACVDGILFSAAGWWPTLAPADQAILDVPRRRAMLRLAGARAGPDAPSTHDLEVALGIPSVHLRLQVLRLKYAARVARHAPATLSHLIDGQQAGWVQLLCQDLAELQRAFPRKLAELPPAAPIPGGLAPWTRLWCNFPAAWGSLTAAFLRHQIAARATAAAAAAASDSRSHAPPQPFDDGPAFPCGLCSAVFPSRQALGPHRFRVTVSRTHSGLLSPAARAPRAVPSFGPVLGSFATSGIHSHADSTCSPAAAGFPSQYRHGSTRPTLPLSAMPAIVATASPGPFVPAHGRPSHRKASEAFSDPHSAHGHCASGLMPSGHHGPPCTVALCYFPAAACRHLVLPVFGRAAILYSCS